ncbi:pantoate--beta-alanine ligase [Gayadomonas joobiniege]|uniref:pantoate--beta-alanine ligase n=1 Tax=Gayadomonas joobiniege TaxID=1234606 RepID=UPI000375FEF7
MLKISQPSELRRAVHELKVVQKTIAFVPTMGNLHKGHLRLVEAAKQRADIVIVSIFVNPMQFAAGEDLDTYPHTPEADEAALRSLAVDILFTPQANDIYPKPLSDQSYIEVPGISTHFCGASRDGHFRGVATIVNKLFNLVQPDYAMFGKKDYQQLQVIRTMVEDLCMPIKIIGVDTVREASGLAMSSRNGYLSADQKEQASLLYKALCRGADQVKEKSWTLSTATSYIKDQLTSAGFDCDYIEFANRDTMQPANEEDKHLVLLAAAFMGSTRLIDNIEIDRT